MSCRKCHWKSWQKIAYVNALWESVHPKQTQISHHLNAICWTGSSCKVPLGPRACQSWHSSAVLGGYYRKLCTFLGVIKFQEKPHEAAPWAVAEHHCCPMVGQAEQPSTGTLQQASWQTPPSQAGSQELRTRHDFLLSVVFFPLCFY